MKKADLVLKSNAVFTGLTDQVFKGSVAICGNRIERVGMDDEIIPLIGPDTKVYEYDDELIMAGFNDSHFHLGSGLFAASEYFLDLTFSKSEVECVSLVKDFADKHPEFEVVTGIGWNLSSWEEHSLPNCSSIDNVVPDKPVFLYSADGHAMWLNSKALEAGNITRETKVSIGEIVKDNEGEVTGILLEMEAINLIFDMAFKIPDDKKEDILKKFLCKLSAFGITSISDMSETGITDGDINNYQLFSKLDKEGELKCRFHLFPGLGLTVDLSKAKELNETYCTEKLRICGLKQFADGVTSTYTGCMLGPYSDKPETSGSLIYPIEVYKECVINANKEGFSVRLHSLSDGAVRSMLDIFSESNISNNGNEFIRNGLEHCENIHPDDIPRFSKLGVISCMQPYHLVLDANEKISRIGIERCRLAWPCRSLLDAGAILALSTDYPVIGFDPFPNIYAAVTRCDENGMQIGINPQERITIAQALRAYTYGGAYTVNREKELGTLEEGKLADVIVLNKNLFNVKYQEILDTTVILTVMDGQIIFQS
jgi:predicted amidohydrolase YtcJ